MTQRLSGAHKTKEAAQLRSKNKAGKLSLSTYGSGKSCTHWAES